MIYRRSVEFKKNFKELPEHIQAKAVKAFALFKANSRHPSLQIKKIKGSDDFWEGRVNQFYRFVFEYDKDDSTGETICRFLKIGRHDVIEDV